MKRPFPLVDRLMSLAHLLGVGIGLTRPRPPEQGTRGVPERAVRDAVRPAAAAPVAPPTPPQIAAPAPPMVQAPTARLEDSRTAPLGDDPPEEMGGASPVAAARRRERARCAAIMTSPAGLKHPQVAFALAFHTTQSVDEALAALDGISTGAFAHLAEKGLQGGASRYRAGPPH